MRDWILAAWLLFVTSVIIYSPIIAASEKRDRLETVKQNEDNVDRDPAEELFKRLFKKRRAEQLEAAKGLLRLDHYERQFKMVNMVAEKVFSVIHNSRVILESSGYVPGSRFPKEDSVRDALSNILENTAIFGDILLRLPEMTHEILHSHHEWEVMFGWSLGFCNETGLLDAPTTTLINLVAQELNITERDPSYVNPYRRHPDIGQPDEEVPQATKKKKRKKEKKKGPQLTGSRLVNEL